MILVRPCIVGKRLSYSRPLRKSFASLPYPTINEVCSPSLSIQSSNIAHCRYLHHNSPMRGYSSTNSACRKSACRQIVHIYLLVHIRPHCLIHHNSPSRLIPNTEKMGHADHALECERPSHPFGLWPNGGRMPSGQLQGSARIVPEQCR